MSEIIEHHGILGQKWGVKNGPPYPLKIGRRESQKMNKKGYVLEKDTLMYRTTGNQKENNIGETFASFSENDKNLYNNHLCVNVTNPNAKAFNLTMKLKEDLIVPSQKQRVEAFVQYYSLPENSKKIMKYADDLNESRMKTVLDKKDYRAYLNFCFITNGLNKNTAANFKNGSELLKQKEKIVDEYHEILKKKGYNATVDDLDAVNPLAGQNPVIIFDRGKTVDIIDVSEIIRTDEKR